MKFTALFVVIWILSIWIKTKYFGAGAEFFPAEPTVQFVGNYDGDTFRADISGWPDIIGRRMPVRIAGIDTAEMTAKSKCERKMALRAKNWLTDLLKTSKEVRISNLKRGRYFRIVADVYVDGLLVSEELLKKGLAVRYKGGRKRKIDWCSPLKAIAPRG